MVPIMQNVLSALAIETSSLWSWRRAWPVAARAVARLALVGTCVGVGASPSFAQSVPTACASFTDPTLPVGTPVKAAHLSELRACVDAIRALNSLSAYSWTDSSLTPGVNVIKAVHISELRTALDQVYSHLSQSAPAYTDSSLTAGTTTIKRAHVQELRTAALVLYPPLTPTISPATGTYTTAQAVTLSIAESGVSLRYTTDGSDPTASSTLYTATFQVSTGTTVKARTFRAGGATSASSSAVYTFNYGTLPTPNATPGAGAFQQPPAVSLNPPGGGTIYYTLDGSDPTESSFVYAGAIAIPSNGAELRAKAFHPDWTASPVLTANYVIDTTAPTIAASVFPPPNPAGWNDTPVTVTFVCSDNVAVASCPTTVLVSSDGFGQLIQRTATDTAGNTSSASVTLSIDSIPPVVALTTPPGTTSATQLTLSGQAGDALSGLGSVWCNDNIATVVEGAVTCVVTLSPGRNSVILQATDMAGNSISTGAVVLRADTATTLTLSPSDRALLVNEKTHLNLLDEFGVKHNGAAWTSADPAIVSVSEDDPPILVGIAPGVTTITASKDGLTASATVRVIAGVTLPSGTERWKVANAMAGSTMDRMIVPRITAPDAPDMIAVERLSGGISLLRALNVAGQQLWTARSPGIPVMGDSFGGVLLGVHPDPTISSFFTAIVRIAGADSVPPWRYESQGHIEKLAQAPDGTIYAIEWIDRVFNDNGPWVGYFVAIDGQTGRLIRRRELEREIEVYDDVNGTTHSSFACRSRTIEDPAVTHGPIVGNDGRGYLLVRRHKVHGSGNCQGVPWKPITGAQRTAEAGIDLIAMSSSGTESITSLYSLSCSAAANVRTACDFAGNPAQIVPDGAQGLLAVWSKVTGFSSNSYTSQAYATRIDDGGTRVDHLLSVAFVIESAGQGELIVARTSSGYQAVNPVSWATLWNAPVFAGTLPSFTSPNGATFFEPAAQLLHVVENGVVVRTEPVNSSTGQYYRGAWITQNATGFSSIVVAERIADTTFFEQGTGNPQGQKGPRQICGTCTKNYIPPDGHGPFSATDPRRILTVAIDPTWEELGIPGNFNQRILVATQCAITRWNNTRDAFGNFTGFIWVLDQTVGAENFSDVRIAKGGCGAIDTLACIGPANPDQRSRSTIWLPQENVEWLPIRDSDLCGRIAHEFAHKLGGAANVSPDPNCLLPTFSILQPRELSGRRSSVVTPFDIELVNQAFMYPGTCTAIPGQTLYTEPIKPPQ
jgi:hypothetical protein